MVTENIIQCSKEDTRFLLESLEKHKNNSLRILAINNILENNKKILDLIKTGGQKKTKKRSKKSKESNKKRSRKKKGRKRKNNKSSKIKERKNSMNRKRKERKKKEKRKRRKWKIRRKY